MCVNGILDTFYPVAVQDTKDTRLYYLYTVIVEQSEYRRASASPPVLSARRSVNAGFGLGTWRSATGEVDSAVQVTKPATFAKHQSKQQYSSCT